MFCAKLEIRMAYWLVKSEPFKYSWADLVKDGETFWDGVRNYAARNNLRAMKVGDPVLFYHSNEGLEIVGIAQVVREAYPDPTAEDDTWSVVNLKPLRPLKKPVGLQAIKANPALAQIELLRLGRLSVVSIKKEEWDLLLQMAGE